MSQDARHPSQGSPNSNISVPQPVRPGPPAHTLFPEHRQHANNRSSASPQDSTPHVHLPQWNPAQVIWRLENGRIVYESDDPAAGRVPACGHRNRSTSRSPQGSQSTLPTGSPSRPPYPVTPHSSAYPELVESHQDNEDLEDERELSPVHINAPASNPREHDSVSATGSLYQASSRYTHNREARPLRSILRRPRPTEPEQTQSPQISRAAPNIPSPSEPTQEHHARGHASQPPLLSAHIRDDVRQYIGYMGPYHDPNNPGLEDIPQVPRPDSIQWAAPGVPIPPPWARQPIQPTGIHPMAMYFPTVVQGIVIPQPSSAHSTQNHQMNQEWVVPSHADVSREEERAAPRLVQGVLIPPSPCDSPGSNREPSPFIPPGIILTPNPAVSRAGSSSYHPSPQAAPLPQMYTVTPAVSSSAMSRPGAPLPLVTPMHQPSGTITMTGAPSNIQFPSLPDPRFAFLNPALGNPTTDGARLVWDLAEPPRLGAKVLTPRGLYMSAKDIMEEPVSQPTSSTVCIYHAHPVFANHFGWLNVKAKGGSRYVTVGDLLDEIYMFFQQQLSSKDYAFVKEGFELDDEDLLIGFRSRLEKTPNLPEYERLQGFRHIDVLSALNMRKWIGATTMQYEDGSWFMHVHTR